MATNNFGLDTPYFTDKMKHIISRIHNYTPAEFAREMARMSVAADKSVIHEPEFRTVQAATCTCRNDERGNFVPCANCYLEHNQA